MWTSLVGRIEPPEVRSAGRLDWVSEVENASAETVGVVASQWMRRRLYSTRRIKIQAFSFGRVSWTLAGMIPRSVFNRAIMSEARVMQEYRELEARLLNAMTPALTNGEFSEIALEVFAFQCRWNVAYRAFAANAPAPRSWREIPAVPQVAFKRSKMSCVPIEAVQTVFRTSGTTGETRGEHHFLDTRLYDATIVRGWDWLGVEHLPLRVIARRADAAPDSSLTHMFAVVARERVKGDAQWFVDRDGSLHVDAFQRSMENGEPVGVLGTALGFLNLFERLGERRIALPRGSFVMETGGYKGSGRELTKRELYEMFDHFLGVPERNITNEY